MATITPMRYPGAKNKMLPILMPYIDNIVSDSFADAFVGGGSVLLAVAQKYPNIKLYANDKDYWIYCFWKVVVNGEKLNDLFNLMIQKPTVELFNNLRNDSSTEEVMCAYKAIFFNRTTFSGILKSGQIGGRDQKSKYTIDCRYNFTSLKNKILNCHNLLKHRTIISNLDFKDFINNLNSNCTLYCDPPYFVKGDMLYRECMKAQDHNDLYNLLNNRINWVLSYDDCDYIRKLYVSKNIFDLPASYCIDGKKKDWKSKNELIIIP